MMLMKQLYRSFLLIALGLVFATLFLWLNRVAPKNLPLIGNPTNVQQADVAAVTKQQTIVSGVVVPHHDIVKAYRQELFAELAKKIEAPKTVILVSPNHYDSGQGHIQTRPGEWEVGGGTLPADDAVITALLNKGVTNEAGSFSNEHGIKVILLDIKTAFPDATVVPLILKESMTLDEVTRLHDTLDTACHDCLLVASVDFSHYQPALLANLHDRLTRREMELLDVDGLYHQAEVDSPAALALLAKWAQSHHTERLVVKRQTNSGEMTANPDIETTTHLFGWYQAGDKIAPEAAVSFIIGGDMMFGRMIAHTFLKDGLWKSVDQLGNRLFWGTDAGIVNLEGPVSDVAVPDNIEPNNLTFNFPPESIDVLKYLKVNAASLGNNHSANAGRKGLETTHKLLDAANIQYIGGPAEADAAKTAFFIGNGLKLHVIGFQTLAGVPDILSQIKELKNDENNRVLIFPHWGNEYQYNHSTQQEALAHSWIDAGADLVIGAHPHVVEDSELYKGKPIIYSMGNLLFDQTFSKETQQGLLVAGEFTKDGLTLFALPTQSSKLKPALMRGTIKQELLDRLYVPFADYAKKTAAGTLLSFPAN